MQGVRSEAIVGAIPGTSALAPIQEGDQAKSYGPQIGAGAGGGARIQKTRPTWDIVLGAIDGFNTNYTTFLGPYVPGSLRVYFNPGAVSWNQLVDLSVDLVFGFVEANPATGAFDVPFAPAGGTQMVVHYDRPLP